MFTNDYKGKKELVKELSKVYKNMASSDIDTIELKKYKNKDERECEFILLTWKSGAFSTANNHMNSLSATARNVARMLDGGVYECIDFYKKIMNSDEWEEE